MHPVFLRIARFSVRHRILILICFPLLAVTAGIYGRDVSDHLIQGGFNNPDSESSLAANFISDRFTPQQPAVVLLVRAVDGSVDDPEVERRGNELAKQVAKIEGISQTISYWQAKAVGWDSLSSLKSDTGDAALIVGTAGDSGINDDFASLGKLALELRQKDSLVEVEVGGIASTFEAINSRMKRDLAAAELIALPLTFLLLVLVFRGLIAALLPVGVGGLSILLTTGYLKFTAQHTDVSIFAMNLVTMMGFGLAIDYCLFIVGRFREELENGATPEDAAVSTVTTAGRTVAFSSLVVAASLAAGFVFPIAFLRSFAWVGVGSALTCAFGAVSFLPALLTVLGPRVNTLSIRRSKIKPVGEGIWHRQAMFVMRRPITIVIAVVGVLILLGSPFLQAEFGVPDDRVLPPSSEARRAQDRIRADFDADETNAFQVAVPRPSGWSDSQLEASITNYAADLSKLANVDRVDSLAGVFRAGKRIKEPDPVTEQRFVSTKSADTWISVVPAVEVLSAEGSALTDAVRSTDAPFPDRLVGGSGAIFVDGRDGILNRVPLALTFIAITTFILLFLMFGSILVPLKALVINTLSLSATFGSVIFIFQQGHFAEFFDITATGTIPITVPVLMFCVAFGLSMDYEVFLISRIKEQHDLGADNRTAVAVGLEQSGRIVTAAALLISLVFISFAIGGVSFVKAFGIGLAIAVLLDAFVIRGTLVPAFMRLAGEANWWAPKWMRRIYERAGLQH